MKSLNVSVPSWVIPGTYGENLSFLEDKEDITNIELLFFIYDDSVREELDADLGSIKKYRKRFTYTVHLPDHLKPEQEDLVATLSPLVEHFVFHPVNPDHSIQVDELSSLIFAWQARYGDRFCAENTKPGWLEALEAHLPTIPICMDTGHLALVDNNIIDHEAENRDSVFDLATQRILSFWESRKSRIQELHLHSTDTAAAAQDQRLPDHRPLLGSESWLVPLTTVLMVQKRQPLINLELFSWQEVEKSLKVLQTMLNNLK